MLSPCQHCQSYSEPSHSGDLPCAIAPVYAQMWEQLQAVTAANRQALPIEPCPHWEEKRPYDLDAGCIRRLEDGQWAFLNRIRKGWSETGYYFASLSELLEKEKVQITGAYTDDAGEFFTVAAATPTPATLGGAAPETFIFMHLVASSNIQAIGYDGSTATLYVAFHNDTRYRYRNVPRLVYLCFLQRCVSQSTNQACLPVPTSLKASAMKSFLIQRLYRQGDTDTAVLLGGRLTLHCRTLRQWQFFRWASWGTNTNGRILALQNPWCTIVISQAEQSGKGK